jgi:hypothetical protein
MRQRLVLVAVAVMGAAVAQPAAAARLVPRPAYKAAEVRIETPYVVVHYTRVGPDHPRFMKDDDRDNVPNYIEKLAAAANKAWLWYAHNGFKAPLPDTAGGNAKVDIYVKALPRGVFGLSVPPARGQGGGFMTIDNQLDMAHLAKHGSLQQTVAHELFHMFQFSYVPDGNFPVWAAEGSAVAMQTYVYPGIIDVAAFDYLDHWLDQPWRSVYDDRGFCDHCYGGALFWRFLFGLGGNVVSEYFGRLYGYQKTTQAIGDGTQPLDEILQKKAHGSLYSAFTRFSYDIYRAGYRPLPLYRLRASTALTKTPVRVVRGLATHYIPIAIPASAKAIGIGVAAGGGPDPEVKLVVGGPKGRVIEGVLHQEAHEQFFATNFATKKERQNVMLIVTSGRAVGTAYFVTLQTV